MSLIVGVDEAGRGPLVGSVVAAAVILHPQQEILGLADSKQLTEKKREQLFPIICERAFAWGIAVATAKEIDQINILQATMLAMQRAVKNLKVESSKIIKVVVDGNKCPDLPFVTEAIVKGDAKVDCIGAASILAKVTRDRQMHELDQKYPEYGFAKHKGYPTAEHQAALQKYGPCPLHRFSYAPVKRAALVLRVEQV